MDYFVDFILVGVLVIASTAFLGSIAASIVRLFTRGKAKHYDQGMNTKQGWRKLIR